MLTFRDPLYSPQQTFSEGNGDADGSSTSLNGLMSDVGAVT